MPTDYQKGIIYKLCCKDVDINDEYVGSTVDFIQRRYRHKSNCTNENSSSFNLYVYQKIREYGGWNNWNMIEVERYPTTDRRALETRERYWIKKLQSSLNKSIPTRTKKEYNKDNQKIIAEKQQEYY